jgi:hypothetical protein
VEPRGGADARRVVLQLSTAGELDVFELVDTGKMAVDQAGVGQRPEVFGRLELGRVRRPGGQGRASGGGRARGGERWCAILRG